MKTTQDVDSRDVSCGLGTTLDRKCVRTYSPRAARLFVSLGSAFMRSPTRSQTAVTREITPPSHAQSQRSQTVFVIRLAPLNVHAALLLRGLAELQKGAVAQLLFAEPGLAALQPIL